MYQYKLRAYRAYYAKFIKKLSLDECAVLREDLLLLKERERCPQHYTKYLTGGVYEFRVSYRRNEFRVFFIYDGDEVILLNGFKKKTQKLPTKEIRKAIKLKEAYYAEKKRRAVAL